MIIRVFCMLVCAFTPLLALAQTATIRSGEHRDFTRVVVPVPLGSSWQVEQEGRSISMTVPGFTGTFDTSRMFELIPRERVVEVRSEGDTLTVILGCDCGVAPFVTRDRFVVLDIAPRDTTLASPFIEPVQLADTGVTVEDSVSLPILPLEAPTLAVKPKPTLPTIQIPIITTRTGSSISSNLIPAELPQRLREPLSGAQQDALKAMQQRLAQELSTAATRGVLTPQPGRSIENPALNQIDAADENTPSSETETTIADISRSSTNNIRVTSSIDVPLLNRKARNFTSLTGITCTSNEKVDVGSWADDRAFHEQIGKGREQLFGEFDQLSREGALKLAKLYIYFGFGAEALHILSLDPDVLRDAPLLRDLAQIMEHGIARENSDLQTLVDCQTDIALWAILSKETLEIEHSIDPNFALTALNRLPVHLRKFVAPALSQRFLSHGDAEAAATALRNIERLPSALPSAAKLAQANIAIDSGDLEKGTETLEDVIDDNALQSPEALITLVDTRLNADQPIDPETAGLIEAYAKELEDADIGPELRRAHVLALIKSGQFDRGFAANEELGGNTEEQAAIDLRQQVLKEVTSSAEDIVFLEYIFEQSDRDLARLPNRTTLTLARRLLDLGFPAKAEEITVNIAEIPLNIQRQLLLAEIALILEEPERALTALDHTEDQEADLLRAQAQLMAGAHLNASALFQQANQPEAALNAAWLAEGFDPALLNDDPVFGPILALAETSVEASTEPAGMLQRSGAALQESEAARQTLSDFLAAPRLDVSGSTPEE